MFARRVRLRKWTYNRRTNTSGLAFDGSVTMPTDIERRFHQAMVDIYRRAKAEARYNATRFLSMVTDHGGLEAARILLHAPTVSEGYTALWERKRLDLSVEAVMLQPEWHPLFSDAEREIARRRLAEYGFEPGS